MVFDAAGERVMRRDPLAHPEQLIQTVYAYVAYRVGPGPDAEDITSDVFERALRYRASYDPKRGEPVAWLIGIARRCIDGVVSDPHRAVEPLEETMCAGRPRRGGRRRLTPWQRSLMLGERDRELIALRYGADLTGRQIGEILDMSANAVDVAVHRAVERLRQALDSQGAHRNAVVVALRCDAKRHLRMRQAATVVVAEPSDANATTGTNDSSATLDS